MKVPRRIVLTFWTIVAFFFVAENVSGRLAGGRPIDWEWDVLNELLYWALWAALTPLITYWLHRFPLQRTRRAIGIHALWAAVISFLHVGGLFAIHAGMLRLLGPLTFGHITEWVQWTPGYTVFLLFTA